MCQLFNTSSCPFGLRCKFKHTCGECGGSHSAKACSFTPMSAGGGSDLCIAAPRSDELYHVLRLYSVYRSARIHFCIYFTWV